MRILASIRIRVWDAQGRTFHDRTEPSRSLVRAFLAALLAKMREGSLSATYLDVYDVAKTLSPSSAVVFFGQVGGVNDDTDGIVVGTSAQAVDITDSKLISKIAHGTGADQMVYQAQTNPSDITTADPSASFIVNRNFNNNSGADITVRETGIQGRCAVTVGTVSDFLMCRDTRPAVVVPDGGGCNVEYTFEISE